MMFTKFTTKKEQNQLEHSTLAFVKDDLKKWLANLKQHPTRRPPFSPFLRVVIIQEKHHSSFSFSAITLSLSLPPTPLFLLSQRRLNRQTA